MLAPIGQSANTTQLIVCNPGLEEFGRWLAIPARAF